MTPDAAASGNRAGLLDRSLPWAARVCILLLLALLPTWYVVKQHDPQKGFTSLVFFGEKRQAQALPEVRELKLAVNSPYGYDGQFYAQVAVDPLLRNPGFRQALDAPAFRAQRILMSAMAFVLGLGNPSAVIEVYAVLNLGFWLLLAGGLVYFLRLSTARGYLCLAAILLTAGSLFSIQRALTDLPMAALAFYAMALSGTSAAVWISLAMLTKPTAGLLLLRYAWPFPRSGGEIGTRALRVAIALSAPILWVAYLYHVFGTMPKNSGDLGCPFQGWVQCIAAHWTTWRGTPFGVDIDAVTPWEWKLFEVLAPLSLMFQVFHLAIRRDPASAYWWMGIGFAALFVCLTTNTFVEQIAYTRDVLPLTIAFNIQLLRQKGAAFVLCFLGGNLGLLCGLHDTLGFCIR